jgi:hypothetical protein
MQTDEILDGISVSYLKELGCAGPIYTINDVDKWIPFPHQRMDDPSEISFLEARENG